MADTEVLEKKLSDIADGIKEVQARTENLEKKHDGLDVDVLKKAQEDATKGLEAIQSLEQKLKADELVDRLFAMEKTLADNHATNQDGTTDEHKAAFYGYLRKGTAVPQEVVEAYCKSVAEKSIIHGNSEKMAAFTKDMVEGSNPDGGYFITPERSTQIIKRVFETSPMRLVANVTTTASSSIEFVIDDDEASAGWVGETQDRPDTDTPQIGLKTIVAHELYAQPKATQRMLDDAGFDLEGWLQGKVTRKFSRLENTSFVVGDGSKKPKGFLALPAWAVAGTYERDALEHIVATGTAGSLNKADDVIDLQNSLIDDYQNSAVFTGTRETFGDIMKLKDTQGRYLLNSAILREGVERMLLGKRFIVMQDMPEVAANALALGYGDFGEGYTIVDRFGVRVLRDPYTSKPYIKFYTTKRTGGDVTNFEAIKVLKINA